MHEKMFDTQKTQLKKRHLRPAFFSKIYERRPLFFPTWTPAHTNICACPSLKGPTARFVNFQSKRRGKFQTNMWYLVYWKDINYRKDARTFPMHWISFGVQIQPLNLSSEAAHYITHNAPVFCGKTSASQLQGSEAFKTVSSRVRGITTDLFYITGV